MPLPSPPSQRPTPSSARFAPAATHWLARPGVALALALGIAALAVIVGLLVPRWIPLQVLQEDGPIETGTVWVYLAAVLSVVLLRWRGMPLLDAGAACIVLLAMAAREADLHTALFGISMLKSRFYLSASFGQIATALAVLLPIVLSGLWLVARYVRHWWQAPTRWNAPAATLAVLVGAMVFAKMMDRTPDTLIQLGLRDRVPDSVIYVMLALEEILEFALPVFAILAMLQCRWLALRRNVTK